MKVLLYTTSKLLTRNPTVVIKRFIELTKYMQANYGDYLCCADDCDDLKKTGLYAKYHISLDKKDQLSKILPPEIRIAFSNRNTIKAIRNEKYDYVISFDVPPTVAICLMGIKNIVLMIRKDLIGYYDVTHPKQTVINKTYRNLLLLSEGLCISKSKAIITQCKYDSSCMIERHPHLRKHSVIKYRDQINNVNPSWVANIEKKEPLSFEGINICFIGNFNDERKGHGLLLKSASEVTAKRNNVKFHIIGGGKDLENYKKQYCNDRIVFYGFCSSPASILASCDLNIVPSKADSCPNTIMESLFVGTPVIGSRAGGIPEILLDEDALFDLSENSLVERILMYIDNNVLLEELAAKQQKRKEELSFDWGECISQLIFND